MSSEDCVRIGNANVMFYTQAPESCQDDDGDSVTGKVYGVPTAPAVSMFVILPVVLLVVVLAVLVVWYRRR
jgi:hypothetical protein